MMNKLFSPATRIAIGLSGAVLAVCCVAKFMGLLPDKVVERTAARVEVAESIAMSCTALLVTENYEVLESYLAATVSRNDALLSCAIRNEVGEIALVAGDHSPWVRKIDESGNAQLQIPLLRTTDEKWGDVELRFRPLRDTGWLGIWQQLDMELMLFMGLNSFLFFSLILRFVLKQLDPSRAVPQRVREALNNLAEGLMIVDAKLNILLVNNALARVLKKSADLLIGVKSSTIAFESMEEREPRLPWAICLEDNRPISNFRVRLKDHGMGNVTMP